MRNIKIYCPKCHWVPQPFHLWVCVPECGCRWHTFDTCGVCPQCGKNWEVTACHACKKWSPHIDWYHEEVGGVSTTEQKPEETQSVTAVP